MHLLLLFDQLYYKERKLIYITSVYISLQVISFEYIGILPYRHFRKAAIYDNVDTVWSRMHVQYTCLCQLKPLKCRDPIFHESGQVP